MPRGGRAGGREGGRELRRVEWKSGWASIMFRKSVYCRVLAVKEVEKPVEEQGVSVLGERVSRKEGGREGGNEDTVGGSITYPSPRGSSRLRLPGSQRWRGIVRVARRYLPAFGSYLRQCRRNRGRCGGGRFGISLVQQSNGGEIEAQLWKLAWQDTYIADCLV